MLADPPTTPPTKMHLPHRPCAAVLAVAAAPLLAAAAHAQTVSAPAPLVPAAAFETNGLEYRLDRSLLAVLEGSGDRVRLEGVLVPTSTTPEPVDLVLRRHDVVTDDFELRVDGALHATAAEVRADLALYAGFVAGEPGSDVYLAFGREIATGWIARADGTAHVFAIDDPEQGFAAGRVAIVHEADPALQDPLPGWSCQMLLPPGRGPVMPSSDPGDHHALGSMVEVLVSVETDYQYYQLFNNLQVAADYALALWGAIDLRYMAQASAHVRLPYLGLYTNANDPWSEPDTGNSGSVLGEFRGAWAGNIPNGGDLGHFLSGANLGGGVAYLDVLCNSSFGFAVSGNLGGRTPFPVQTTNALNWDFYVTAHELGHNFGTPHTHDYCPTPLDECSPSFGSCQSQQVCVLGTIMSYCHLCPGGVANVAMNFHPTVSALITAEAAGAPCLGTCTTCDQPPLVDFTAAPTSGAAPLITTFTAQAYGDYDSLLWDFGDGTTSTSTSTGHVYVFPGSYDVSLTVVWSGGVETVTKLGLIQVDGGSNASATSRNGSGTNPAVFSTVTLPYVGSTWVSEVDAGAVGATGLSFVFGYGNALAGLPTVFGELLIDPTSTFFVSNIGFVVGGTATHSQLIPNDTSLIGTPVYTQAFLNGPGLLTNALDLILGT